MVQIGEGGVKQNLYSEGGRGKWGGGNWWMLASPVQVPSKGKGGMEGMVHTGPLKLEKYLNLKNKIPGIEKSLIFVKNLNKPGKVLDLDQPVMFCC